MRTDFIQTIKAGLVALGLALGGGPAMAEGLSPPHGSVILTVSGQIECMNGDGAAMLDQAMLDAMGMDRITTSTVWTKGVHDFEGVPLASVLAALGARGSEVRVTALNDYTVTIPMAEITPRAPMLAVRMNGVALSPRDKGPVWVIYPFDEGGVFQQDVTYARSIWQLVRIEVLP